MKPWKRTSGPDRFSRREFLGTLGAGGLAAIRGPIAPAYREPAPHPATTAPFELEEATLVSLQEGMAAGRLSASSITQAYLDRIAALDRQGPSLHHIIEINPDAIAIAEQLDRERSERGSRGPLHGIPVLIKDNIATADRMTTTAGSLALEGSIAPKDAFIAERLRAAGAVLLAKTNLSEWANFRSSHSTSGWSSRGGQCRNPYALDRNPCGSSSGSGAGVSANLGALAIGTETDGSIVCPASTNGVVGIKPTLGLVSRSGIIPIAHSQDTAGPLTRTVADAAALLGALAGPDPRDPATATAGARAGIDYTRSLDADGLLGARIGVARARFFGYHDATDRLIEVALDVLRSQGAVVVDPANIPHLSEYDAAEFEVLLYEFKADLNKYLAGLGSDAPVRTLADIITFNQREHTRVMPYFGQETLLQAQEKGPLTTPAYRKALARCTRLSRTLGLDAVFTRHRLDAVVAPTGNPAWPTDLINGDHFLGSSSTPAAVSGYPSISVPAGYVSGLPVGLSFIGRAWSEPALIRYAYSYEQASQHRRAPKFLGTVDLGEGQ